MTHGNEESTHTGRAGVPRRKILKGAATAGALAAGASLLPPSLLNRIAEAAPAGSLEDVEHVIFLMQENRSFDHYFGTLRGVQGFGDESALKQRDGSSIFEQKDGEGNPVLPFPIRQAAHAQSMNGENVDALNHDWEGGTKALNHGWCDQWIPAKTSSTMAHYDRQDLPFQFELADTFTVCDQYFCSCPTSTSPNRNYFFSGYTGFEPLLPATRAVDNRAYDDGHLGYDWTCLAEILEEAGISWKVYQEWDNFTDNNLEFFKYTKKVARKAFPHHGGSPEKYYSALKEAHEARDEKKVEKLTRQLEDALGSLNTDERKIFDLALFRGQTGTLTDRVAGDIDRGELPAVSWIVPSGEESEHPSASSPRASANLIYRLLDALGSHPEVWDKTALIITFDENDGYFDHVPPPRPPKDVKDEWYQGQALGMGNRVPTMIISPWTVGGYRCSQVFDHTSAARFLETWKGISVPQISAWRRRIGGDLLSAFDFANPQAYRPVQSPEPTEPLEPRWKPKPPDQGDMPEQESGRRPQRPLPYDLSVRLEKLPGGAEAEIVLRNAGPQMANFLVFPYHEKDGQVTGHDVLGEERVKVALPSDGNLDITVVGPAGFRKDLGTDESVEDLPSSMDSSISSSGSSLSSQ